jgi:hypothetical protein
MLNQIADILISLSPALLLVSIPLFVLVKSVARRRRMLRQAGLVKRRIRTLSWNFYGRRRQKAMAEKLSDRELLWAQYLPDHTREAKAIVTQELIRRGHSCEEINKWAPDASDLTVPLVFPQAPPKSTYDRLVRRRLLLIKGFRFVLGVIAATLTVSVLIGRIYNVPDHFEDSSWQEQVKVFGSKWVAGLYYFDFHLYLALAVVLFGVPIVGSLLFRNRSIRILLLRPFGDKRLTKPLKKFVVRNLGHTGYVYTLSDRGYRPSVILELLAWLPIQGIDMFILLVLTPIIRNSTRVATVKNERRFRRLQNFLLRKIRPAYISFLSGGQALNIRTKDRWWKCSILTLMYSCDVIVVDLSLVKQGTEWELDQLESRGLLAKCIFVVGDAHPLRKTSHLASGMHQPHIYRSTGALVNPVAFLAEFNEAIDIALRLQRAASSSSGRHQSSTIFNVPRLLDQHETPTVQPTA